MIKTFLTLLTSFSLVTLPLAVPNITQENPIKMNTQLSENETIRIAYESLDRFNKNDGKKTSEKEIICYESIYNGLLEEIGILATLKDEYAIIIIDNNQGIVIELGARNAMPYKNYDGKKVYLGPLNYYTVNNNIADDVSHDKSVSISSLRESELNHIDYFSNELESSRSPQNPTPDDIYKYIYNYSSYFVYCAQPDDYSCVPTSFAMCLKYLNNRNKFALYNGMSNIYSMRNELYYNYMVNSNGRCREPKITNGFNDFCDDNTNKTI